MEFYTFLTKDKTERKILYLLLRKVKSIKKESKRLFKLKNITSEESVLLNRAVYEMILAENLLQEVSLLISLENQTFLEAVKKRDAKKK